MVIASPLFSSSIYSLRSGSYLTNLKCCLGPQWSIIDVIVHKFMICPFAMALHPNTKLEEIFQFPIVPKILFPS